MSSITNSTNTSSIQTVFSSIKKGLLSTGAAISRATAPLHPAITKVATVAWAILSSKLFLALSGIALLAYALDRYFSEDTAPSSTGETPTGETPPHDTNTHPFVPGNVPAPPTRITAGCVNLGNSCWFNSSAKGFAGTTSFLEPLLNANLDNIADSKAAKNLREVVPFLKIVTNELRNNRPMDRDLAKLVLGQVGKVNYMGSSNGGGKTNEKGEFIPEKTDISQQHDPEDFFRNLISDWKSVAEASNGAIPPPPTPTTISEFKPIGHSVTKKTTRENFETLVRAQPRDLDLKDPTRPLRLSRLVKQRRRNTNEDGLTYDIKEYFDLSAPSLIVQIKRAAYDVPKQRPFRCDNPVQIDLDSTGTRPVITFSANKNTQEYLVKGTIIQRSNRTESGHYVYVEVNSDGKFYEHNDSRVNEVPLGNCETLLEAGIKMLSTGTIFFLEKVVAPTV